MRRHIFRSVNVKILLRACRIPGGLKQRKICIFKNFDFYTLPIKKVWTDFDYSYSIIVDFFFTISILISIKYFALIL